MTRNQTGSAKGWRIFILLFILALVGAKAVQTKLRTTSWEKPLEVILYPINADGSAAAKRTIAKLTEKRFQPIVRHLAGEAEINGLPLKEPLRFQLAPEVKALPPTPPRGNPLLTIWWSLKMRWWAKEAETLAAPSDSIRLFLLYYDPKRYDRLPHSLGLEKGLFGLVHLFAGRGMTGSNQVVITHELLHTLGATDKYDPQTNLPIHPDGYAEPDRAPLHPQSQAEIMGGRIPLSATKAKTPKKLSQTLIGPQTAREINWLN